MDKPKLFNNSPGLRTIIGIAIELLLVVFEIMICVQLLNARTGVLKFVILLLCFVSLDVLCGVDLFLIKNIKARVAIYIIDFIILLIMCALTGNAYLAAMYCITLTQMYLNLGKFKHKIAVFITGCVGFVVTCIVGWFINHMRVVTYDEIIYIISGCLTGLIMIAIHFAVENFLLSFYHTNLKLTAALKDADESKARLEEAYKQLSETAVYEERNRIARDIHDNAGHSMTAVIMQTEAAKLLIDSNPEEAKAKIISANIQAKNALEQMRDSVHLLAGRRGARSVKEQVEEILAQTMDGTGVNIRSDISEAELSPEKARFITNSLKECLANGVRHGGANAFYVELSSYGENITLTVSDNGSGLKEDFKEGFGLKGIREKAAAFGGSVSIEGEEDEGCEIKITIKAD